MRNLNKQEKEEVSKLIKTSGFKIIEQLFTDFEFDVLRTFRKEINNTGTITTEAQQKFIQQNNYLKGVEDFIRIIKGKTSGIGKRKED